MEAAPKDTGFGDSTFAYFGIYPDPGIRSMPPLFERDPCNGVYGGNRHERGRGLAPVCIAVYQEMWFLWFFQGYDRRNHTFGHLASLFHR